MPRFGVITSKGPKVTEEEKRKYQPPPTLGNKSEPPEDKELKKRILSSKIKRIGNVDSNFTGEETMNWLIKMEDETIIPGALMLDGSQFSMPLLMDSLFDKLERYTFEVNKRNKIRINCQRPSGFKEKVDHFHRRKISYIRAHMSSEPYSMVFNAVDNSIDVFIIPTELLVGFDPYETDFEPFVTIDKLSVQESSSWGIDRKKLTEDDYSKLCRRLVGQLIKVIEGTAKAEDKFTFSTGGDEDEEPEIVDRSFEDYLEKEDGFHAGEQLPTAMQSSYLQSKGSDSEEKPESETEAAVQEASASVSRTPKPLGRRVDKSKHSGMFDMPDLSELSKKEDKTEPVNPARRATDSTDSKQTSADSFPSQSGTESTSTMSGGYSEQKAAPQPQDSGTRPGRSQYRAAAQESSQHSPPLKPGPIPAPDPVPPPIAPARPAPSPEQLPTPSQEVKIRESLKSPVIPNADFVKPGFGSTGGDLDLSKQVDDAQQTVVDACSVIVSGIDDALESLHETGIKAMKSDNLETVTQVMAQTKRLKTIKERLARVIEEVGEI